jgi:hypothetical protein
MATVRSSLQLRRTSRWRPEYTLEEDGVVAGTVAWGDVPNAAEATVGGRSWRLRRGAAAGCIEARDETDVLTLHLHAGEVLPGDGAGPALTLRRHRRESGAFELCGPDVSVALRPRHRTLPGLDIELDGVVEHRELVLLLAGYDLLA